MVCGREESCLKLLGFGPKEIKSVGVVSGGVPKITLQAIDEELDLFITGDASHEVYHESLESGLNVLFAGHYITETWGIKSMATHLAASMGLETNILHIPTGL